MKRCHQELRRTTRVHRLHLRWVHGWHGKPVECVCDLQAGRFRKGALFINTLRSIVNDDRRWWALLHNFYQCFKYQTIMTEDIVAYFNRQTGRNLTPIFDQYLRHTAIPVLELKFDEPNGAVAYRWKVDEAKFAMPVRVGAKDHWQIIQPRTEWQTMKTPPKKDDFAVATDLYFIEVAES